MRTNTLLLLVLALPVLGCGGEPPPSGDSRSGESSAGVAGGGVSRPGHEPTKVIVTSDDASLPDGCRPRQVAGLVISFVNAFNSGNQASLSRIFFLSESPSPPD